MQIRFFLKVKSYHPNHTLKCYILQLHHESRRYIRETERAKLLQNNKEIGYKTSFYKFKQSIYQSRSHVLFFIFSSLTWLADDKEAHIRS